MSMWVEFRKEWTYLARSYRFLIVVVVLVFFGLASPFLAKYLPEIISAASTQGLTIQIPPATVTDAIGQYIKNIEQFGILLVWILAMGAVAQEKDKGTAAMMLVKPMPRGIFLSAKFLSLAMIVTCGLILAGIAGYYYTYLLFEAMDPLHWLVLNALVLIYLLVILAITLFCSTLTKSQVAAGGIALAIMIIPGQILVLLKLGKYLPGELLTWATRLMQGSTNPSWIAFGVSIGLIVVPLLAAWLLFNRQEL
jgi:ABC-2 type transport system permease protein